MSEKNVVISGVGLWTPSESVSNEELVEAYNGYVEKYNTENAAEIEAGTVEAKPLSSAEFITKASGIKSRYVYRKEGILDIDRMRPKWEERSNEEISHQAEVALIAARKALEAANKKPEDVDAVIVSCAYTQRSYPAVAIEVQEQLGIKGFGFDMLVACSAATFALQRAYEMVKAGTARCVLAINPELTSPQNNWRDRDSHFIFGDVCTAIVVEAQENATSHDQYEVVDAKLKTQFSNNIRNNFGFLNRCAPGSESHPDKLFVQQGRKVFKEVSPMVAKMITDQLESCEVSVESLKRMWLHQANLNMNQLIAKRVLGREATENEAPVILDEYANTSSAGSIIAFHKYRDDLVAGDLGVICSFGAGYSVGTVLVRKCG